MAMPLLVAGGSLVRYSGPYIVLDLMSCPKRKRKADMKGTSNQNQTVTRLDSTFEKKQQNNEVPLCMADSEPSHIERKVHEIEHTQAAISSQFKDGKKFEDLMNDMDKRKVDP